MRANLDEERIHEHATLFPLFRRQRCPGTPRGGLYFPVERTTLVKELGGADTIVIHARVRDRSATGSRVVGFNDREGARCDEFTANILRSFSSTKSADRPALTRNGTNVANVPDDRSFQLVPSRGLLDLIPLHSSATTKPMLGFCVVELQDTHVRFDIQTTAWVATRKRDNAGRLHRTPGG